MLFLSLPQVLLLFLPLLMLLFLLMEFHLLPVTTPTPLLLMLLLTPQLLILLFLVLLLHLLRLLLLLLPQRGLNLTCDSPQPTVDGGTYRNNCSAPPVRFQEYNYYEKRGRESEWGRETGSERKPAEKTSKINMFPFLAKEFFMQMPRHGSLRRTSVNHISQSTWSGRPRPRARPSLETGEEGEQREGAGGATARANVESESKIHKMVVPHSQSPKNVWGSEGGEIEEG